jgi:ATP-dependent protease ClpP protease subunit
MNTNWDKYHDDAVRAVRDKGVIPIVTDIKPELASIVIECVLEAILRNIKNITVLIDTNGGEVKAGISIANSLALAAANGVDVRGLVLSKASSAGFIILQACNQRIACRGSSLMVHWGQSSLQNRDIAEIVSGKECQALEQIINSRNEMLAMLVTRSGLAEEKIREMCDNETSLYPQQAMDLNLLDSITDAGSFLITSINGKESV